MVVDGGEAAGTQPLRAPLEAKRGHAVRGATRPGSSLTVVWAVSRLTPLRNGEPSLLIQLGGRHYDE